MAKIIYIDYAVNLTTQTKRKHIRYVVYKLAQSIVECKGRARTSNQ